MLHKSGTKVVLVQADAFDKKQYQGLSSLRDGDTGTVMEDSNYSPFVFWDRTNEVRCVLSNQLKEIKE